MFGLFKKKVSESQISKETVERLLDQAIINKVEATTDPYGRPINLYETINQRIRYQLEASMERLVKAKFDAVIGKMIDDASAARYEQILQSFENGEFAKEVMKESVRRVLAR